MLLQPLFLEDNHFRAFAKTLAALGTSTFGYELIGDLDVFFLKAEPLVLKTIMSIILPDRFS